MLLNAIKQAHDHFGENNIYGYRFSGAQSNQDIMYDKLMKKFAPNLITWFTSGIYLKPESVQKLKDQNPDLIEEINNQIHQATSKREMSIKQSKKNKNLQRSLRRITP
jgi:mevalonate kinase